MDFESHATPNRTLFKVTIVVWALYALCSLTAIGGLGYIAVHFIRKLW